MQMFKNSDEGIPQQESGVNSMRYSHMHKNKKVVKELAVLAVFVLLAFVAPFGTAGQGAIESADRPVLSAAITVLPEYKAAPAGAGVRYALSFTNLGNVERTDIVLSVAAISETGRRETYTEETIAIQTSLSLSRTLFIPESAPPGRYELRLEVKYDGQSASATDTFDVVAPPAGILRPQPQLDSYLLIAVLFVVFVFAIVLYFEHRHVKRLHEEEHRHHRR